MIGGLVLDAQGDGLHALLHMFAFIDVEDFQRADQPAAGLADHILDFLGADLAADHQGDVSGNARIAVNRLKADLSGLGLQHRLHLHLRIDDMLQVKLRGKFRMDFAEDSKHRLVQPEFSAAVRMEMHGIRRVGLDLNARALESGANQPGRQNPLHGVEIAVNHDLVQAVGHQMPVQDNGQTLFAGAFAVDMGDLIEAVVGALVRFIVLHALQNAVDQAGAHIPAGVAHRHGQGDCLADRLVRILDVCVTNQRVGHDLMQIESAQQVSCHAPEALRQRQPADSRLHPGQRAAQGIKADQADDFLVQIRLPFDIRTVARNMA